MASSQLLLSLAAAVPAALLSGVLTWAIRPLLMRVALASPNARSSHRIPTPQGAGIAVIAATLIAAVAVVAFAGAAEMNIPVAVFGATLFIAAVGFADDVHSIPVVPRLLLATDDAVRPLNAGVTAVTIAFVNSSCSVKTSFALLS